MKRYELESAYNGYDPEEAESARGDWVKITDAIKAIRNAYEAGVYDGYEACADGAMIDIDVYAKHGAEDYANNLYETSK